MIRRANRLASAALLVTLAAPGAAQTPCVVFASAPAGKCEATRQDISRWLPAKPISVVVDGQAIVLDPATSPPVFIKNGRTYVELNAVFSALGMTLGWEQSSQRITATRDDLRLVLHQGYAFAYKQLRGRDTPYLTLGNASSGWASPFIAYTPSREWKRTVVPVSFIAAATGADVQWDPQAQRVSITRGRSYFFDWFARAGASNPSGTYIQYSDQRYRAAGLPGACPAGQNFDDEAAACNAAGLIQGPFPARFGARCQQLGYSFCGNAGWPKAEYLRILDSADLAAGNTLDSAAVLALIRGNPELYGVPNEQNEIVSAGLYSRDGSSRSAFVRSEAALPPFVLSARRQTDAMVRTAYLLLPPAIRARTAFVWVDRLAQDPDAYVPYLRKKQQVVLLGTFMGLGMIKAENDAVHEALKLRHARELFKLRSALALVKSLNLEVADVLWAMGDTHSDTATLQQLYTRIASELQARYARILDAAGLPALKRPIGFGGDELAVVAFARSLGTTSKVWLDVLNPGAQPRYDGGRTVQQLLDLHVAQVGLSAASSPGSADFEYYVIARPPSDSYVSTSAESARFAQINALPLDRRRKSYLSDVRFPNGAANADSAPRGCEWLGYSSWGTGSNNIGMALGFAKLLSAHPSPQNARRLYLEAVAHDVFANGYFEAQRGELRARVGSAVYQHHPGYREDQPDVVYNALGTANAFVNERMLSHFAGTGCLPAGSTTPFKLTAQLWRHFEAEVHLWPVNAAAGEWLVPGLYRTGTIAEANRNMAEVLDPTARGPAQVRKVDMAYLLAE